MTIEADFAPKHIFISYSRKNLEYAKELVDDLDYRGYRTWIDIEGIEPGTPNWERKIRDAIQNSFVVILMCSPNVIDSPYIQAELNLAQKHNCPIIPVWTEGETWVDCIPLGFVNYQYIDLRGKRYSDEHQKGLEMLSNQLSKLSTDDFPTLFSVKSINECPERFVPIILSKESHREFYVYEAEEVSHNLKITTESRHQLLAVNSMKYESFQKLLNDIYISYLAHRYKPFTYGQDWVLAKVSYFGISLIAVPWEWLIYENNKPLIEVAPDYFEHAIPLAEYGFGVDQKRWDRCVWAVVNPAHASTYGLFTSNENVVAQVFESQTKRLSFTLGHCEIIERSMVETNVVESGVYDLKALNPQSYKSKFVLTINSYPRGIPRGMVFVIR